MMYTLFSWPHWLRGLPLVFVLGGLSLLTQAETSPLLDKYHELEDVLDENSYGIPVYIQAEHNKKSQRGEVYGIIYHPYDQLKTALSTPANWCEIIPQHLNIKGCTYQYRNPSCQLTVYSGRKHYEHPDDAHPVSYNFVTQNHHPSVFSVILTAVDGPLDTRNYRIKAEVTPLSASTSFIHFSFSFEHGFMTRLATSTYLATLGNDKVGFTVTATDTDNNPVYVDGVQGIIERNAVRYYLAIQSYLDTRQLPEADRFATRIKTWYELTENHHRQLHELDKQAYLAAKTREWQDQHTLQAAINHSPKTNGNLALCQTNHLK